MGRGPARGALRPWPRRGGRPGPGPGLGPGPGPGAGASAAEPAPAPEGAALVTARGLRPWGEGVAAVLDEEDIEGGGRRSRLAWIDAEGRPRRELPPPGPGEGLAGGSAFASLALAAAAGAAGSPRAVEAMAGALGGAVPAAVVADGRVAAALDPGEGGGGPRLLRMRLGPGRPPEPEALDLAPLRLGGHRLATGLALQHGWLWVMVADPVRGFDLLRAPAAGRAPAFEPVLEAGAGRFALNAAVGAAVTLPQGLLIGTAALAPGPAEFGAWGPELILVRPDGGWDLIWGQPRPSLDGLKRPLSGRLPGPDDPGHAAVRAIATEPSGAVTVLVQDFAGRPVRDRHAARPDAFDYAGEARAWRSADLRRWERLPLRWPGGLGAATTLAAIPGALLVGHEAIAGARPPLTRLPLG